MAAFRDTMLTYLSLQIFTTSNFAKVRFKLYSRLQTAVQWCNVVRAVRYCAIPLYLVLPRITICITISDDNADHGTAVTRNPHVYLSRVSSPRVHVVSWLPLYLYHSKCQCQCQQLQVQFERQATTPAFIPHSAAVIGP